MSNYTVQNLLDLGFTLEELHARGVLAVNPDADVLKESAQNPDPAQNPDHTQNADPAQNADRDTVMNAVNAALADFKKEMLGMMQSQNARTVERAAEPPKKMTLDDALVGLGKGE